MKLAIESVENGWGGPFGAVVVKNQEIVARGQNRVLLTGDPTAHAEIEAIRKAVQIANPYSPSIAEEHQDEASLELVPRSHGAGGSSAARARMLMGHELYAVGAPCPMCLGAIYWARLERVYYSCGLEATSDIGFSDAFFSRELLKPEEQRSIPMQQIYPELGAQAYRAWLIKPERHLY